MSHRVARLLAVGLLTTGPLAGQAPAELTITYLANMGVVLEAGGRTVVVDGFHHGELADYAAVPPRLLAGLEGAEEPYRRIDLGLTTHRHLDHFAARSVAARLSADPAFRYVAAAETVDTLLARHPELASQRVVGVTLQTGGERRLDWDGLAVTVLDLPHNSTPRRRPDNVGFLIEIGGRVVLHVGDAEPQLSTYLGHRLASRGIDVAVVPFWYLAGDRAVLLTGIGARQVILTHVPINGAESIRERLEREAPGTIVFTVAGESRTFR